jgi:hypothetical protein
LAVRAAVHVAYVFGVGRLGRHMGSGGAGPVNEYRHRDHYQHVADAEHVVCRDPSRSGKDVTQERELRIGDDRRVGEMAGLRPPTRCGEGASARGHRATVGGNDEKVQSPPGSYEQDAGQVPVGPHEEPSGRIGQQVRDVQDQMIVSREHRDHEHLVEQCEPDQIEVAEAEVGKASQASP